MPISLSNKPAVAITIGDPSGIGPEITIKSLTKSSIRRLANYIIVGNTNVLQKTAIHLRNEHKHFLKKLHIIREHHIMFKKEFCIPSNEYVSVLDLQNVPCGSFLFGKERAIYGKASIEYIKKAYELIKTGIVDCIVTAPINKSAVKKAGFKFPGHTEYFASLQGTKKIVMMLVGGPLRVSLVTRHIPISDVPKHLTSVDIADTIEITLNALRTDFNIPKPKIGVCALNPHSGEGGIFGKEEIKIITPAVKKFQKRDVVGPIPADAIFYDAYRGKFDCVICLYHDQGLIPLKMIARDSGVNVTLGLGFIRTSPDHGVAFDIAGKGKADSHSMEMAIRLAVSMANNRRKNDTTRFRGCPEFKMLNPS